MAPNHMAPGDYVFKIMLLGDGSVGKTNLINQYVSGKFEDEHIMTLGVNFFTHQLDDVEACDGKKYNVKLQIWDLGGQDRWGCVRDMYYPGAAGGLLVYDTTNYESYQHMNKWLEEANKNAPGMKKILVGNKIDLVEDRTVDSSAAQEWAFSKWIGYAETSAKTKTNVNETFYLLCQMCMNSCLE